MPLYDYYCQDCDIQQDVVKPIAELDRVESCLCGKPMLRRICAPAVVGDYPGYNCPITGNWIEGRKAHINNLHQHGCRVYEPGETEAFERRRKEADGVLDSAIDRTVEKFVTSLDSRKLETLQSEVAAGVTATVERT